MAEVAGIEPTLTESKAVVLPLNDTSMRAAFATRFVSFDVIIIPQISGVWGRLVNNFYIIPKFFDEFFAGYAPHRIWHPTVQM